MSEELATEKMRISFVQTAERSHLTERNCLVFIRHQMSFTQGHLCHDYSKTPDVNGWSVGIHPVDNLGSFIAFCSKVVDFDRFSGRKLLCKSKVKQLWSVFCDENVCRFDISVHDALAMDVLESVGQGKNMSQGHFYGRICDKLVKRDPVMEAIYECEC